MARKKTRKGKKYPPEPLTGKEVEALIKVCSRRAPTGIRAKALIALLYRTGLRISEALDLKPKDVNLDKGTVRVLHGKGDRSRTVGIDSGACAMIQNWLDVRRKQVAINGHGPLFCTLKGDPIDTSYIRRLFPRLAKRAGIEKRVHAHGIRHSLAYELANEGVPIHQIKAQLGHSNIATTSRYIDHIAPTQVIDTMRAREWNPPK